MTRLLFLRSISRHLPFLRPAELRLIQPNGIESAFARLVDRMGVQLPEVL